MSQPAISIEQMSREERLALLDRLWDSLVDESADIPIPDCHRRELDARLDELDHDIEQGRELGLPWDEVARRIRTRR